MKNISFVIATIFILGACSAGQGAIPGPAPDVMYLQQASGQEAGNAAPSRADHVYVNAEKIADQTVSKTFIGVVSDGKPVTGAPYSATATTESTQVLADGNRIVNKTVAYVARDSQGRTRREESLGSLGRLAVSGPRMVFITDPVAKTDYILDLKDQTAQVMKTTKSTVVISRGKEGSAAGTGVGVGSGAGTGGSNNQIVITSSGGGEKKVTVSGSGNDNAEGKVLIVTSTGDEGAAASAAPEEAPKDAKRITRTITVGGSGDGQPVQVMANLEASGQPGNVEEKIVIMDASDAGTQAKTESLGAQTMEGVAAEGKRTTRTIPAGKIGNERPIEITSEVWTSPDLHEVVLSKSNDPRIGEIVYRLTDIKRSEPDHSLFEVPAGFTVKEEGK
jgi:hypothetical protein